MYHMHHVVESGVWALTTCEIYSIKVSVWPSGFTLGTSPLGIGIINDVRNFAWDFSFKQKKKKMQLDVGMELIFRLVHVIYNCIWTDKHLRMLSHSQDMFFFGPVTDVQKESHACKRPPCRGTGGLKNGNNKKLGNVNILVMIIL